MKEKTNFFKKFITSIYDLKVFSTYVKEGFFNSIIYALLLALILGGTKGMVTGYRFNQYITTINKTVKSDNYQFSINDGVLNVNKSPIKIESNNTLIYLDKEKYISDEEKLSYLTVNEDVSILLLRDGIIVKNPVNQYNFEYTNPYINSILNNILLDDGVNIYKLYIIAIVVITVIFATLSNLLINCLIVVVLASVITILMRMVVKYSALCSLTIYAATLPLIIKVIFEVISPRVNFDIVFIVGTLLYVIFILMYIKSEIIENIKLGKLK